jgi:hypothetical protein
MRRVGRAIALVCLLWLVALVLGALGVVPHGGWLFGHAARLQSDPSQIAPVPALRQPALVDLARASLPETAVPVSVVPRWSRHAPQAQRRTHGHSASAPGQTGTTPATTTHGRSATAPGHTRTPTTHGRSATAPGHTKTTTTTHGRSSTAPGHTKTKTHGRTQTPTDTTTATPGNGHAYGHNRAKTP